eukprot:gene13869-42925_t
MDAAWALEQVEGKDKPAIRLFTLESWLCYVINAEHRAVWFGRLDPFAHPAYGPHIGFAQCLHLELLSLPPYIGTVLITFPHPSSSSAVPRVVRAFLSGGDGRPVGTIFVIRSTGGRSIAHLS